MAIRTLRLGMAASGGFRGVATHHERSFCLLLNGLAPGQKLPEGYPFYPGRVKGARVVKLWTQDPDAGVAMARLFGIEHVVRRMEDVAGGVDGVILPDDVTFRHQRRAPYFLNQGLPTFIDKPLAPRIEEAEELAALAKKHAAPLMTGSSLRYSGAVVRAIRQVTALGPLRLAVAVGPGDLANYAIHTLEPALQVFGAGAKWVEHRGRETQHEVRVEFSDGRTLLMVVSQEIGRAFDIHLYGEKGRLHIPIRDEQEWYFRLLCKFVEMVRTRREPLDMKESLEAIRILDAARRSRERGGKRIRI